MNPIKFNEWSDLGQKKDIEMINKKIDSKEPIFLSICIEIVITVSVVLIDHLFDTNTIPIYIWIITGSIAILPPTIAIIVGLYKYFARVFSVRKGKLHTKDYINTFDNSICYWAMMCRSFCDSLKNNNLSNDEKMFYYQEASYYIFKSIFKLDEMAPVVNKIFTNNVEEASEKHIITISRLETIVNVLRTVSYELDLELNNISKYQDAKSKQKKLQNIYNEMMESFIRNINDNFSCRLSWIDKKQHNIKARN